VTTATPAVRSDAPAPSLWAPLRHRDMRRFLGAAAISNLGSWAQSVAIPFAVYELTTSSSWLGLTAFTSTMVSMACNTPGGWAADRFSRRLVLLATSVFQLATALGLWALWRFGDPSIASVFPLLLVNAIGAGMLMPAWQSLVPALAAPEELPSAIRLNSLQFAVSRALGPALGAVLLSRFGAAMCFLVNATSFLAMIVMLLSMTIARGGVRSPSGSLRREPDPDERALRRAFFRSPATLYVLSVNFICAGFGFGLISVAPAIVSEQFGRDSDQGGLLVAAFGVGGVAVLLAGSALASRPRSQHLALALVAWVGAAALLASTTRFGVGLAAAVIGGAANSLSGITLNTSLQSRVPDAIRGRAMAQYMQMWFLGNSIGSLMLGAIGDLGGIRAVSLLSTAVFALFVSWSRVPRNRMHSVD
jgi:MFS family permease